MDKYLTEKKFWEKRAKNYDELQWTKRAEYIKAFIKMCETNSNMTALDLGTGTGTIACALSPIVKNIIGIDISMPMLLKAQKHNHTGNIEYMIADIRNLPFLDNSFNIITARMVFHHLITGINKAFTETYRVLKPGGLFCLSEGVPPCRCVDSFYKTIFALKEKRRTFYPDELKELFIKWNFKDIKVKEHIMKHCSIKNWLQNSGQLSLETRNKIYNMHINLHKEGKKVYNMKVTSDDCLIDMKFIIVSGRK